MRNEVLCGVQEEKLCALRSILRKCALLYIEGLPQPRYGRSRLIAQCQEETQVHNSIECAVWYIECQLALLAGRLGAVWCNLIGSDSDFSERKSN